MEKLNSVSRVSLPIHEIAIGLEEQHRGKGIGTILLRGLLAGAVERGIDRLCLSVSIENTPAQRLYDAADFMVVGTGFKSEVRVWEAK